MVHDIANWLFQMNHTQVLVFHPKKTSGRTLTCCFRSSNPKILVFENYPNPPNPYSTPQYTPNQTLTPNPKPHILHASYLVEPQTLKP